MPTSTPVSPPLREPATRIAGLERAATPARTRTQWVDVAKGIGIVLVVVGHALDGLLAARLVEPRGLASASYFAIYTFHMPLFFLLAGLFVPQRLANSTAGFLRDTAVRVAWPYLLWSVVQLAVIDALGNLVNQPSELDAWRIVALLWEPTSQFWFLQALLVLTLLGVVLLPRIGAFGLVAVMAVARLVEANVELPHLVALPARFGVFYALGIALGPLLLARLPAVPRPRLVGIALTALVAWAVAAAGARVLGQSHWSLAALPAAVLGTIAVVALATLPRAAAFWIELGRASMAIFLLHVLFVAGARIGLHKGLGIEQPLVILLVACTLGIAAPLLVRALVARAGLGRVTGLG
jgi:fucose 4-O-acetylase-like acetyltransferase